MKQRLLFFIESLNCGGAEKSLISLLPFIDYDRYDVDLLTLRRGGVFEQYVPSQVRFISLPDASFLRKICNAIYSVKWRLNMKRPHPLHNAEVLWSCIGMSMPKIRNHYDVAIAYQQGLPTYYVASKVNADKKIAWVNTHLRDAKYRESFNRRFYDKVDHVVAVSDRLADFLKSSLYVEPSKVTTIYDILNTALIRKMSLEYDASDSFNRDGVKLVTVGRIATPKNYPLAVRAAKVLKEHGIEFCWCFVGDGPESQNVSRLIADEALTDCVKMLGMRANPYPLMLASDIYVQTSSFEGFGLTIAEAKILNKPIVSTRFDIVHEQLTDGVNGLIADMTAEDVAEKIMILINDESKRQQIINNLNMQSNGTLQTETAKFNKLLLKSQNNNGKS